uniref:Uncharacterized protein n=1 Tax=Candidatus Kentrum sp. FW TaxID=2126338 RepID=A0A450T6W6_9GAMM|nr:MAG: hypothetical protein BECKFW1821B_GA0114236_10746 [Candidatus Kentron sp. FW]
MHYEIFRVSTDVADAWIIGEKGSYDYAYGGTRKMAPDVDDDTVEEELFGLMHYESHFKNCLINQAITDGALDGFNGELPEGFMNSRIGGGRCLFRPKNKAIDEILSDPAHEDFGGVIKVLFQDVGSLLNKKDGRIKLTPDFGKFAGVSDILGVFTPHVLGIRCEDGGCGGKASYTSTGIIMALETFGIDFYKDKPVTLIGSDGALGTDITNYFLTNSYGNTKVCDIAYEEDDIRFSEVPDPIEALPANWGMFTDHCLQRGGVIVTTTVGNELENSNWRILPENTLLVLAHNLALPRGEDGRTLAYEIENRNITLIPGQILTLGGALTSRLEWFSRKNGIRDFDKQLAHRIVGAMVTFLLGKVTDISEEIPGETMYEKMASYAQFEL